MGALEGLEETAQQALLLAPLVTPATLEPQGPMETPALLATPEALEAPVTQARMATPGRLVLLAQVLLPEMPVARGMLARMATPGLRVQRGPEQRRVPQAIPVLLPTQRTRTLQSSCGRHIPCRSPHRGKS